jgi:two-component sensor histidine kinase
MPDSAAYLNEHVYEVLLENMSEGFVICEAVRGAEGRLVDYWLRYLSPTFSRRVPERIAQAGRRQLDLRPDTPAAWLSACNRALAAGRVAFEYQEPDDGRWYEVTMVRISEEEFGQFFVDINGRKQAEQRRDELFRELNHRVKNNLAMVSSILELQARQSGGGARHELEKAVDRIRAIADLHTALQGDGEGGEIELKPYVEALAHRLEGSLFGSAGTSVTATCAPLRLRTELAVNLGLVINELVTNAAKHAAAGRGTVAVAIDVQAADGEVRVVVADDGPGFPGGAPPQSGRLGWRLSRSLVHGLGGEVTILPGPGARIELRFPSDGPAGG